MRRFAILFLTLIVATAAYGQLRNDPNLARTSVATAFSVVGWNEDVDAGAFEVVADDAAYVALAAKDSLEIVSSSGSDNTQRVRINYIKVDSTRRDTVLRLNGTTLVTFGDSVLHFQSAYIDSGAEAVGTLTVRTSGNTAVTRIPAGGRATGIAHLFAAEREKVYLSRWRPTVYTVGDTTVAGKYVLNDDKSAAADSLIGATGDTTVVLSVLGAADAVLGVVVTVVEGDQTDTIRVLAQTSIDGTTFGAYVAIDSLLVTAADAGVQNFVVNLLGTEVTNAFGSNLDFAPYLRLSFLPKSLASDDTLRVQRFVMRGPTQGFDGATVELRVYEQFEQILDSGDGYVVVDKVFLTPSQNTPEWRPLNNVLVPEYGYAAVFARGKTDNRSVFVAIEGYSTR